MGTGQSCLGHFEAPSACTSTCGTSNGFQCRTYKITRYRTCDFFCGKQCPHSNGYKQCVSCSGPPCCEPGKVINEFGTACESCPSGQTSVFPYTECVMGNTTNNGNTSYTETPSNTTNTTNDNNTSYIETPTNSKPCVGSFGPYGACDAECEESGQQSRTYTITDPGDQYATCPHPDGFQQTVECSGDPCPPPPCGATESFKCYQGFQAIPESGSMTFVADITFPTGNIPTGQTAVLWEVGGNDKGASIVLHDGNIVFRAGAGARTGVSSNVDYALRTWPFPKDGAPRRFAWSLKGTPGQDYGQVDIRLRSSVLAFPANDQSTSLTFEDWGHASGWKAPAGEWTGKNADAAGYGKMYQTISGDYQIISSMREYGEVGQSAALHSDVMVFDGIGPFDALPPSLTSLPVCTFSAGSSCTQQPVCLPNYSSCHEGGVCCPGMECVGDENYAQCKLCTPGAPGCTPYVPPPPSLLRRQLYQEVR